MTLIMFLLPYTMAVYLGFFFIFSEEVFNTDFQSFGSGGFFDFLGDLTSLVGDLFQFVTLGGTQNLLNPIVQTCLLLVLGLGWLVFGLGLGRGSSVS